MRKKGSRSEKINNYNEMEEWLMTTRKKKRTMGIVIVAVIFAAIIIFILTQLKGCGQDEDTFTMYLLGNDRIEHQIDTDFEDPGVEIRNQDGEIIEDQEILNEIKIIGSVNTARVGEYKIEYHFRNQEVSRVVKVVGRPNSKTENENWPKLPDDEDRDNLTPSDLQGENTEESSNEEIASNVSNEERKNAEDASNKQPDKQLEKQPESSEVPKETYQPEESKEPEVTKEPEATKEPVKVLVGITAEYDGTKVTEGMTISKDHVTVKAEYNNGTSEKVTDYKLEDYTIVVGENKVTVSYQGKVAEITVPGKSDNSGEGKFPDTGNPDNPGENLDPEPDGEETEEPDKEPGEEPDEEPDEEIEEPGEEPDEEPGEEIEEPEEEILSFVVRSSLNMLKRQVIAVSINMNINA